VYALPSSNVIDRLQQIGGTLLAPCVLAGDQARVLAFLRSPRNIAVSRSENVPFVVLMALMVLRPGS